MTATTHTNPLDAEQELRETLMGNRGTGTFDINYLVEAGAGAGKSYTMTKRIGNLLLARRDDGTPFCAPEELVAITFTVKATQELRTKLEQEFRDRLAAAEEAERNAEDAAVRAAAAARAAQLRALTERLDRIQVSTIDSFCRKLLTTMPFSNPLGLSGVMESDETRLAKDFFARARRNRIAAFRKTEERYALRYTTLESAFLACCARGDFRPMIPDSKDPKLQEIEQKTLSEKAQAMLKGIRDTLKTYPFLKGMLHPELTELLALPDADFAAGKDGLARLILFYCTHRTTVGEDYNSVVLKVLWDSYYNRYAALCTALFKKESGLLAGLMGKPKTLPMEDCRKALDAADALIAATAEAADWLDPGLLTLLDDCRGVTFFKDPLSGECAELTQLRSYFAGHKTQKSLKKLELKQDSAKELIEAYWKPKLPTLNGKPKDDPNSFGILLRNLLHRDVMNLLAPCVEEYAVEKRQLATATFNDVLVMARNMLRDSSAARAFFRRRYRCFYVDEFQDTDAVQTELLFYLAGETEDLSGGWKSCKPRPGSLFLVGDPKQGIYRFRGADVTVYNDVRACFADPAKPIGQVCELQFNFRSTKEICDFSRCAFQPGDGKDGYPVLAGSTYQAEYADMVGVAPGADGKTRARAPSDRSRIFSYASDNDPEAVADFVAAAVANRLPLTPRKNDPAPTAQYGDFLILTAQKADANAYARALRRRDIPALLSGQEAYGATAPIAAAIHFLRYLLEPEDPLCLLNVLHRGYGAAYRDIRKLQKRAQVDDMTALLRRVEPEKPALRLEALSAALLAEQPRDEALLALCAALDELRRLRRAVKTLPAMSALERLFETVKSLWPETGTQTQRRVDYARVQQFLDALRSEDECAFADLARRAIEMADENVEDELALEPVKNCVRIMNLHKAKGLEGEIVILAESARSSFTATEYRESGNGVQTLHLCISEPVSSHSKQVRVIGQELKWPDYEAIEDAYSAAEQDRLLYVAATRAKSILMVNTNQRGPVKSYWAPIAKAVQGMEKAQEAAKAARKAAKAAGAPNPEPPELTLPSDEALCFAATMASMERGKMLDWTVLKEARTARIQAEKAALEKGEEFDRYAFERAQIAAIEEEKRKAAEEAKQAAGETGDAAAPKPAQVDFAARTAEAHSAAEALAKSATYAVTPSRLDKRGHGTVRLRIKDRTDDDDAAADDALDAAGAALPAADEIADDADETAAPDAGADDADAPCLGVPRGKHWGTIVHRALELAVRRSAFAKADLAAFARQAAFETLDDEVLSPTERGYLCCGDAEGADLISAVADQAAKAVAFLTGPDAPLRRLLDTGEHVYTELPFFLCADDRTSALYRHLAERISAEAAKDKTLDVNGIMDLVVRHADGSWTVVDYKTDALHSGETADHLAARLAAEYTGQIAAYCKVLEQQGAKVDRAYLCSVPLGGRLIELALVDAPAASAPPSMPLNTPAPAPASHPASTLLQGSSFAPELKSAAGAAGFALWFQGRRVMLTDKHGQMRDSFKMCRDFAGAVSAWAKARSPGAACAVDFTNAGSVVVLRRLLKMLRGALPKEDWETLELRWETKQ